MSSFCLAPDAISDQVPAMRDFAHIQEACTDRRARPFVQADAVVVAIEVGDFEREMAEGVRAIHNHRDAARVGHLADAA